MFYLEPSYIFTFVHQIKKKLIFQKQIYDYNEELLSYLPSEIRYVLFIN